ncbi:MAG TPA: YdcF family protein, partial [Reyranella sp.]|nr:YdcF family protein [Reyranella sp.]
MFYISKVFWGVMQPGMLLLILVVAGIGLLGTRYLRTGRALLVAAAVLLVLGGLGPLSTWLILPLEDRFARADLAGRQIDG